MKATTSVRSSILASAGSGRRDEVAKAANQHPKSRMLTDCPQSPQGQHQSASGRFQRGYKCESSVAAINHEYEYRPEATAARWSNGGMEYQSEDD